MQKNNNKEYSPVLQEVLNNQSWEVTPFHLVALTLTENFDFDLHVDDEQTLYKFIKDLAASIAEQGENKRVVFFVENNKLQNRAILTTSTAYEHEAWQLALIAQMREGEYPAAVPVVVDVNDTNLHMDFPINSDIVRTYCGGVYLLKYTHPVGEAIQTYKVTFSNKHHFRYGRFEKEVNAYSKREAVETVFARREDANYFPTDDGYIKDSDGHVLAEPDDDRIKYDGGYFEAEIVD